MNTQCIMRIMDASFRTRRMIDVSLHDIDRRALKLPRAVVREGFPPETPEGMATRLCRPPEDGTSGFILCQGIASAARHPAVATAGGTFGYAEPIWSSC